MARGKIVNGMDLDKLETFRASIKDNPITLGLEVKGTWEGHSGRSTVHIGPYRLGNDRIERPTRHYSASYGAWKEVEEALGFVDPTDRAEPLEMALSAVAACLTNSIALNAPRLGIPLKGLEIKVACDIDPSMLFQVKGPESHTDCMPRITTEVTAQGDLTDEQLETIQQLISNSPVHGMLEYSNKMVSTVRRASWQWVWQQSCCATKWTSAMPAMIICASGF